MQRENIEDIYTLSPIQQGILFHSLYAPESGTYFEQFNWVFQGDLDVSAFERAWQRVIVRHPILRSSFFWEDLDDPLQLVHRRVKLPYEQLDWHALPPHEQQTQLQAFLRAERQRGFELAEVPLMRVTTIRIGPQEHQIVWSYHHLLLDGWSVALLLEEFMACYEAYCQGQEPRLERRRPYRDYVGWLRRWDADAAEDFWRRTLRGFAEPTSLRVDLAPGSLPSQAEDYALQKLQLAPETMEALQAAARAQRVTLNTLVQGAWALLLSRYSGTDDVVFGVTVSGRPPDLAGSDGMIGLFINTLPVRVRVPPHESLAAWLQQLQAQQLELRQYECSPLVEVQGWSDVPRGLPLFESIVVFENYPVDTFGRMRDLHVFQKTNYPLTLTAEPGAALMLRIGYDARRFDADTVARILGHLRTLLERIAADLQQRLADVTLLTSDEQQAVLASWNPAPAAFPQDACLHQRFEAQAARTPEAVALVFDRRPPTTDHRPRRTKNQEPRTKNQEPSGEDSGSRFSVLGSEEGSQFSSMTYRELNERANQLAHALRRRGVGPEVPVGIYMERSLELVVALLGILKAGGAYLPLDPAYPRERIQYMLEDAQVSVLLTSQEPRTKLVLSEVEGNQEPSTPDSRFSVLGSRFSGQVVDLVADWPTIAQEPATNLDTGVMPDNLAYVIYTSGSTGRPKGVQVTHANVGRLFAATQDWFRFDEHDVWTLFHSYAFDFSVWELWGALLYGGRLVVVPYLISRAPDQFYDLLRSQRVTVLNQTPSAFRQLIHLEEARGTAAELALRLVIFGGEALDPQILRPWFARRGDQRPQLVNMYGITETTVHVTYRPITLADLDGPARSVIGGPIPDLHFYLLDPLGRPVAPGIPGEIYVGGDGVARGYLNRPELTAERFVPCPWSVVSGPLSVATDNGPLTTDNRLYKTGDLARYLPNGEIEYLGRIDQQVKIRGFRIELGEIEAALGQHPDVREAVVLAREDVPGDKRLAAYVVASQEPRTKNQEPEDSTEGSRFSVLGSVELHQFLRDRLPDYMIPSTFVLLEALPLTPNGKLDRRALPAPSTDRPDLANDFTAPRTPEETIVARIWAEVLNLERVGGDDNFFALGGHSLLATQVLSRLRDACQVELPLRALFEAPTVAGLAERIVAARRGTLDQQAPPLVPVARNPDAGRGEGALPLSFAQLRLWFLYQLEPDSPAYNIPIALLLQGPLHVEALERSLNTIIERHEALRTTFASPDGRPVQVIEPQLTVRLAVEDLQALPRPEQRAELLRRLAAAVHQPFDLERGPLLRTLLVQRGPEEHVLLLTLHHIIGDAWSTGVLVQEASRLYAAFVTGQPAMLPELPIQYADFAVWQRQWLEGAGDGNESPLQQQLAYWKQQLAGAHAGEGPPILELPTDRPRPPIQTFRGKTRHVELVPELVRELTALSQREGTTLFMTLLAAFKVLLHHYSGQDDIVVGSPIAGRTRVETEGLIGCFVNTLALRTSMAGDPSFRELLLRVREVCLGAYAHQDLPFEKLAEELQLERDLSRNPLFQVMFVLQNAPMPSPELAGLTLYQLPIESETSRLDLTLSLEQADDGLVAMCEYNVDLFDDATIERLLGHFRALLEGVVANPEYRVSALPLLTDAERRQILVEWNATGADYPADVCIHHLFEAQAARAPEAPALVAGDQRLTYAELNGRANRLAHHLRTLGVGPGAPVGLCMERSVELIVGMLGVLKAGGAYLPLDPAYPAERLRYMIEDAQVSVLLTARRGGEGESGRVGEWKTTQTPPLLFSPSPLLPLSEVDLLSDWETIARQPATNPASRVMAEALAYVIYTSGATGRPKGVLVPHRALVNHSHAIVAQYQLGPTDRVLQFASPSFDVAAEELFPSWLSGAVVILRPEHLLASLADFEHYLEQERLTVVNLPTPYWHAWVGELARSGAALPPDLRLVVIGSEQALPDRLALWQQVIGERVAWHNAYGPSEATITATIYKPAPGDPPGVSAVPIGRPIANAQTYILDRNLMPVPVGVPGQLYIGGAGLAWGYVGQPGLTAERFVPNPFLRIEDRRLKIEDSNLAAQEQLSSILYPLSSTRLYATGDLARYRPDGTIEFLGRADEQMKVRGYRIEPGEIETALGQHPAVREAVVLAREDTPGHRRLVAYIVPTTDDRRPTTDDGNQVEQAAVVGGQWSVVGELREFLRDRLPDYMVPSAFVLLDALPLNPSGKIDRRALPAPAGPALEAKSAAPATPAEELLAGIWAEVLGVERVGIHDNFFDLGGDSILSIQIIARARQAGLRLDPKLLFRYQTIADLAAVAGVAPVAHAEQGLVTGPLPLTPIQRWFFEQELPAPYHWNQSVLLEVGAAVDLAQLERVVQRLLLHHDALRLRFAHDGASWRQEQAADEPHPVYSLVDLSAVPEHERAATIAAAAEAQASLNLAEGPIVRAVCFGYGAGAPSRLLLVVHHLAVDGFSWRILLEDLELLFRQLLQGAAQARLEIRDWRLSGVESPTSNLQAPVSNLQLPPKTTSFKRWAERLAEYGRSEAIREELDFWLAVPQVAGARLPLDHGAGANTEDSARTVTVALDADATRALLEQVPRAYRTQINEVLLAALVQAFAEWTGERALLLDLEGHGREALFDDVDVSRTVGWFTTIFPVELDLRAAHGPGATLKAAKEQLRAIPGHGIGYGILRYLSQDAEVARRLRDRPQPQVLFNYLGQLDQARPDAALFGVAAEPRGPEHSPLGQRSHLLEINGFVAGGMLSLEWSYSQNLHRHDTIERLAQAFLAALRDLITHCLAPDAGGYSSSDFAPFGWGQDDLDSILGGIRQTLGEVEDVSEER